MHEMSTSNVCPRNKRRRGHRVRGGGMGERGRDYKGKGKEGGHRAHSTSRKIEEEVTRPTYCLGIVFVGGGGEWGVG